MACNTDQITFPIGASGTMDVIDKYTSLMDASLGEGSIYEKTKDTFYELFKDLELDAEQKAMIVSESISKMAGQMSSTAMQASVSWAKEERDGYYSTELLKAQTIKALADSQVSQAEICKVENEIELTCAKTTEIIATSIRENGKVIDYETGTCKPILLEAAGLKYEQTNMVVQQTTSMIAEDVRKDAKNEEDINFSVRQRQSFEDSKRNHAANAASQMISGLIASEIGRAGNEDLIAYWTSAMSWLTTEQPV